MSREIDNMIKDYADADRSDTSLLYNDAIVLAREARSLREKLAAFEAQEADEDLRMRLEAAARAGQKESTTIKTLITKRCSVTAFDMKLEVTTDGRERGLWVWMKDTSALRRRIYKKWLDGAVELLVNMSMTPEQAKGAEAFGAHMRLDSAYRNLLNSEVDDAVLLEWDAMQQLHTAIGKELTRKATKKAKAAPARKARKVKS